MDLSDTIANGKAVSQLRAAGFSTTLGLLCADDKTIRKPAIPGSVNLVAARQYVARKLGAPLMSGRELLRREMGYGAQGSRLISTGCPKIDQMLCGGMMSGDIIEIAGASGTGKTQLLFFIAASVACGSEATVLYVDSKNAFSPRRIVEMYNEGDTFANVRSSGTSHEQILERIRVVDCCTYEDMFKLLDELREKLDTKPDWFWDDLRLIVIDSLGGIFAPINGQSDGQGNFIISEITRSLVSLSANHHLPFLVTNYAVSNKPYGGGNTRGTSHHPRFLSNDQMRRHKPSLGQSWRFLPTIQLFLSMYKEEEESLLVGGGSWAAAVEDADENDEDDGTNKAATGLISSALRSGESASVVVEPMVYTTLKGRTYRLARRKLEVLGSHRTPIGHSCDVHIGGPDVY